MKKDITQRDLKVASLLLTLLVSVDFVNFIINELYGVGGMSTNVFILIATMVICYKTVVKIKFPALVLTFILIVTVYYSVTYETQGTTLFGREFLYYFCFASVLAMYKCDMESLLRYLSYVSLLILPFYNEIFVEMTSTTYNTSVSLGLSYALFQLLMASVFHFLFYREKAGLVQYIIYGITFFLMFQLIMKGTRGVTFSVLFAAVIVFLKGGFSRKALGNKGSMKTSRIVVCVIILLGLYVWFYEILAWIYDVLQGWGIEAHFIDKIYSLQDSGDVLNGRNSIYEYTFEHILDKPFFGHGLSTIFVNSKYRIIYSHNFLLQLLYDGGLFLAVPVLLVIGKALYCVFTEEDENESAYTLFFMSICLPKALFSGDIWKNPIFWVFIMHCMKYHVLKRKTSFSEAPMPVLTTNNTEYGGDDT